MTPKEKDSCSLRFEQMPGHHPPAEVAAGFCRQQRLWFSQKSGMAA
jgi:hypothetical protein